MTSKGMMGKLAMMSLFAGMLSGMPSKLGGQFIEEIKDLTPEEKERLKEMSEQKRKDILLSKGVKEWEIDGIKVLAINKKNAERKVNKLKKLLHQN